MVLIDRYDSPRNVSRPAVGQVQVSMAAMCPAATSTSCVHSGCPKAAAAAIPDAAVATVVTCSSKTLMPSAV